VDRRDWPPLAVTYRLPWEQYFTAKEAQLLAAAVLLSGPIASMKTLPPARYPSATTAPVAGSCRVTRSSRHATITTEPSGDTAGAREVSGCGGVPTAI
jgi:hypothetical protein